MCSALGTVLLRLQAPVPPLNDLPLSQTRLLCWDRCALLRQWLGLLPLPISGSKAEACCCLLLLLPPLQRMTDILPHPRHTTRSQAAAALPL